MQRVAQYFGFAALCKRLTALKKADAFVCLRDVSSVLLQQSLRGLDIAFRNFFASADGSRKEPNVRIPWFKHRYST